MPRADVGMLAATINYVPGTKLRHIGFEMPGTFVIFPEAIGDRVAPSGFDASRKPKHAGRILEHGFHIVRVMGILRSHELGKEGSRLGLVRGGRFGPARGCCHSDKEEYNAGGTIVRKACKLPPCRSDYRMMSLVMPTSLRFGTFELHQNQVMVRGYMAHPARERDFIPCDPCRTL
jgi:hypothetical protein